jgi:hypothetical protein
MWKQTVGDWQERRRRRSGPIPATPQATLPESFTSTEHNTRGFLPRGFQDHRPASAYLSFDGAEAHPRAAPQETLPQVSSAHALTATWVTVTGVSSDDVLDVRDFFDTNVGRTVSHYLPPASRVRSDTVYIQFASSFYAAQAVRTVTYTTRMESAVAAVGIKPTIDAPPPALTCPHYYLEIVVSWCTDQIFLAEREKLRRQLLESAAPLPQRSSSLPVPSGLRRNTKRDTTSPSPEMSGRGSEPPGSSGAANDSSGSNDSDDAAAHPLLPRHRVGQTGISHLSPSPLSSNTESSAPDHAGDTPTPSSSAASRNLAMMAASATPSGRNSTTYYQSGGAYRHEDSFFSDGLHSASREHRQRSTVLALFFHPCSSSSGLLYSLCLYTPLRLVLLLLWTLCNAVRQLFPPSALARSKKSTRGNGTSVPEVLLPPLSHWKQRRSLCASDVVPASASPVEYIGFLLYKYIPFTPDPEEVDVVLWSWLALRSPYPQRSLRLLKQSLLMRQLAYGSSGSSDGTGSTDVNQLARFGSVDVLGGDPYSWEQQQQQQQAERLRELPVLLRWRPAWWFSRYSSLSLLVLTVLALCHCWHSWG